MEVPDQHDRIFDAALTNPFWYHFPSLMVNYRQELVIGFSGSSATEYAGAFYSWFANGAASAPPALLKTGEDYYHEQYVEEEGIFRWGDYSNTSLDPLDDVTCWTIQSYALPKDEIAGGGAWRGVWGTWIQEVKRQ